MEILQWAITAIVGILCIFLGREWQKHDVNNKKDKEVIDEIITTLSNTVSYCHNTDFGGVFNWDNLNGINRYIEICEKPSFFFLDKRLEQKRVQLVESTKDFRNELGIKSFVVNPQKPSFARIPQEHEVNVYQNPHEYFTLTRKLNDLADNMCKKYDDLVVSARRKL